MRGRDRRPRFRAAVYAPREGMTNGCRVLLLRLADGMNVNGVVSVPRSQLASELGVAPARITENIALARKLGFLGTVRRARPGVTAVYQGQIPDSEVHPGVPHVEVRPPGHDLVREGVPLSDPQRYALGVSQVGNADCTSADPRRGHVPDERRIYGEPGEFPDVDEYAVHRAANEADKERTA